MILFLGGFHTALAQSDSLNPDRPTVFSVEVGGLTASGPRTPFWLWANQFGTVPLESPTGFIRAGMRGRLHRPNPDKPRALHIGYGLEVVGNLNRHSRVILPEAYVSLRGRWLNFYGGRRREIYGLVDTLLSGGSYAWSGNALPTPRVQLSTNGFVPLGFSRGFMAVYAVYAHGWLARTDSVRGAYLHHKSVFGRFGRGPLKVFAGINHFVQWAGTSRYVSSAHAVNGRMPSSFRDYLYVITARQPDAGSSAHSRHDSLNYLGNHLGSIDLALEARFGSSDWLIYTQHPFEDKSGVLFKNFPDGLYGVRWRNRSADTPGPFRLSQITAEFLTTLNQSGATIVRPNSRYEGADEYFNNYQYIDGWTTRGRVIGTPFFTRWMDARPEWYNMPGAFTRMMISNNRVRVLHLGLAGKGRSGWQIRVLLSQSWNRGRPMRPAPQTDFGQFSGLAQVLLPLKGLKDTYLNAGLAMDRGGWLPDRVGGSLSLRKVW